MRETTHTHTNTHVQKKKKFLIIWAVFWDMKLLIVSTVIP